MIPDTDLSILWELTTMNMPLRKTDTQNLIHEVRRLQAELDACTQAGQCLNARVEPSLAENERLRAALEKYGAHGMDCSVVLGQCTCGLDQALKGGG